MSPYWPVKYANPCPSSGHSSFAYEKSPTDELEMLLSKTRIGSRRPKRNLNLSCETRSEPFFRRVLQICTHGLRTENHLNILILYILYRLYFAVRETSAALDGATVASNAGENSAVRRDYWCFESAQ